MQDSTAHHNVGMKAAQVAYTESMVNITFFRLDIDQVNCLYLLPNKVPDAGDFSTGRFDSALLLSKHLRALFLSKNIGHKRAGAASLWIRGANSPKSLRGIDPALVVVDELDEMSDKSIELALHRTDGQLQSWIWMLSTPKIPEKGIHKYFLETTQEHWKFRCPKCNRFTELVYPDCLVVTADEPFSEDVYKSHIICGECKREIPHQDKVDAQNRSGIWVPEYKDRSARGFYVNQLSSCVREPWKLAQVVIRARSSRAAEQELWNQIVGWPHVVDGGQIEDDQITACLTARRNEHGYRYCSKYKIRTMGIDIGKWLHYEIAGWRVAKIGPDLNISARCDVLHVGKVQTFRELSQLVQQYQVHMVVTDYQPEERAVHEFVMRHYGFALRCQYARGQGSKKITRVKPDDELKILVARTFWMDMALGRFVIKKIRLPVNIPEEYRAHLKNIIKHYQENEDGRDISKYLRKGDDHYGMAHTYNEIALPLAASCITSQNMRSFL